MYRPSPQLPGLTLIRKAPCTEPPGACTPRRPTLSRHRRRPFLAALGPSHCMGKPGHLPQPDLTAPGHPSLASVPDEPSPVWLSASRACASSDFPSAYSKARVCLLTALLCGVSRAGWQVWAQELPGQHCTLQDSTGACDQRPPPGCHCTAGQASKDGKVAAVPGGGPVMDSEETAGYPEKPSCPQAQNGLKHTQGQPEKQQTAWLCY